MIYSVSLRHERLELFLEAVLIRTIYLPPVSPSKVVVSILQSRHLLTHTAGLAVHQLACSLLWLSRTHLRQGKILYNS